MLTSPQNHITGNPTPRKPITPQETPSTQTSGRSSPSPPLTMTSAYLHLQGATAHQCSPLLKSIHGGDYLAIPIVLIGKVFTSLFNLSQPTYKHPQHVILPRIPGIPSILPYNTNTSQYANVSFMLSYQKHQEYHSATSTTADIQTFQLAILPRIPRTPSCNSNNRRYANIPSLL